MKKRSLFIVVAMVLLLAVVLGMGGTTFAKYITTKGTATETATVAKWGYVVSANADGLFGEKYAVTTGAISDTGAAVVSATADAAGDTNVVAPGTKGQMEFHINGTAEVMSSITVDVAGSKVVQLTKDIAGTTVSYEPIVWAVSGNATVGATNLLDGKTLTGLTKAQLVTLLDELDQASIAANTAVDIDLTISWAWAFSTNTTNDAYDTALGALVHKAALAADAEPENDGNHEAGLAAGTTDIDLGVTITVQQIEPKPAP